MPRALLVVVVLAVACGTPAPRAPAPDGPIDLAALATAIDPGPQPAITDGMPLWLRDGLASSVSITRPPEQLVGQLGGALHLIVGKGEISEAALIELLGAMYALGQLGVAVPCDLACQAGAIEAYGTLDVPVLGDPHGFLAGLIDAGVQSMRAKGEDPTQLVEAIDYVRAVVRAAPLHQRHLAAEILRTAPASAEATIALRSLVESLQRAEDTARAVEVARAVVARTEPAKLADVRAVAQACVHDLQVDCAATWQARAAGLAADDAERAQAATLATDVTHLRRVVAIGERAAIEPAIERAHLLIDLGLSLRATRELEALRAAHPDDARPVVGLIRGSFDRLQSDESAALLADARQRGHHDQAFYELALGMFFTRFLGELLPQLVANPDSLPVMFATVLPQLGEDVDGLARFAPGRAAVLRVVVDQAKQFLPLVVQAPAQQRDGFVAVATEALAKTRALRVRFPDEIDAARLALVLARFGGTPRGDYGVVRDPLPATADGELVLMRAGLYLALAVVWDDATQLGAIETAIAAVAVDAPAQARADDLRADALGVTASFTGAAAAWPAVAAAYRARVEVAPVEGRARLRNNLGVALYRSGDLAGAQDAWAAAITDGDPLQVARLNQLATAPASPESQQTLLALGADGERASTRYQALRWYLARATLGPAERKAEEARTAAVLEGNSFGITISGARGVILDESFSFGLGYSTSTGLVTNFAITSAPWLVIAGPEARP